LVKEETAAEQPPAGEAEPAERAGLDVRIAQELIEQARVQGVSLVGSGSLLAQVTKAVLQTTLDSEMTEHLGYAKGDPDGRGRGNHRNGSSAKTVHTEVGPLLGHPSGIWPGRSPRRSCPSTPAGRAGSTRRSSPCTPRVDHRRECAMRCGG
jgi:hypothetical protein